MYEAIESKIQDELLPHHLEIINESSNHNVPPNSESHFKVIVISDFFEDKNLLKRHRKVNSILKEELKMEGGIHALSIVAKTKDEWSQMEAVEESPPCLGGDGTFK